MERKPYPSDVSDAEWAFVAPYLTLMTEDAPQRDHRLREVVNGLRWMARAGAAWRLMPPDLPPWHTVSQQRQRWLKAGVCATIVQDLRAGLRLAQGRTAEPAAAIFESHTLPSTPERGTRAGYDGAKRRRGAKGQTAVETLGPLLAVHVTAANEQDRHQGQELAQQVHYVTGAAVDMAYVDQGYTGEQDAQDAQAHHMQLEVVTLLEVKQGFVLLPTRWMIERSNTWAARFRRLARDYEQLAETLKGVHFVALAILLLKRLVELMV